VSEIIPLGSPPTDATSVLVVGTDDWAIEQGVAAVERAGYQVARCHEPGEPAFPCNGLRPDRGCPLDRGVGVVVTMRGRPVAPPPLEEFGVVCAVHAGVPLVVAGLTERNPLAAWSTVVVARSEDLATAIGRVTERLSRKGAAKQPAGRATP